MKSNSINSIQLIRSIILSFYYFQFIFYFTFKSSFIHSILNSYYHFIKFIYIAILLFHLFQITLNVNLIQWIQFWININILLLCGFVEPRDATLASARAGNSNSNFEFCKQKPTKKRSNIDTQTHIHTLGGCRGWGGRSWEGHQLINNFNRRPTEQGREQSVWMNKQSPWRWMNGGNKKKRRKNEWKLLQDRRHPLYVHPLTFPEVTGR